MKNEKLKNEKMKNEKMKNEKMKNEKWKNEKWKKEKRKKKNEKWKMKNEKWKTEKWKMKNQMEDLNLTKKIKLNFLRKKKKENRAPWSVIHVYVSEVFSSSSNGWRKSSTRVIYKFPWQGIKEGYVGVEGVSPGEYSG